MRTELEACRLRLCEAEAAASERGAAATRAALQHEEARDQARSAHDELQLLKVSPGNFSGNTFMLLAVK